MRLSMNTESPQTHQPCQARHENPGSEEGLASDPVQAHASGGHGERTGGRFVRSAPTGAQRIASAMVLWLALCAATSRPTPAPEASPAAAPAVRAGYERAAGELLCYC